MRVDFLLRIILKQDFHKMNPLKVFYIDVTYFLIAMMSFFNYVPIFSKHLFAM